MPRFGRQFGRTLQAGPSHASLLFLLLLLIVVAPLVTGQRSDLVVELLFNLVLLGGVYSVGPMKHRMPFLMLTVLTLGMRWSEKLSGIGGLDVPALAATLAWMIYAISIVVAHLFQRREVTLNTILGAVVTYLLAALAFAQVFEILELRQPGSFSGIPETGAAVARSETSNALIYFSLVCITTMGFGDIVPVSSIARPLAVLEGVFGQMYLGVMIARLVGLHIVGANAPDE